MPGAWRDVLPTVGSVVVTADEYELGTVKAVAEDAFKIDTRLQPDYWLPRSSIADGLAGNVRLRITYDQLGANRSKGPGQSDATSTGANAME